MELSEIMVSILIFSLVIMGPVFYYSSLISGVKDKYGIEMSASRDTAVFNMANQVIAKAEELQANARDMTTGNLFTDFVNMLTSGLGTISIMWDFTGMFQNIIDEFIDMIGISGSGWIGAGVMGVILIIITAKILSIALSKEV